jgi:hypothetical protein
MAIEIVDPPIKNGDFSIVFCVFTRGYSIFHKGRVLSQPPVARLRRSRSRDEANGRVLDFCSEGCRAVVDWGDWGSTNHFVGILYIYVYRWMDGWIYRCIYIYMYKYLDGRSD